MIRAYRAYGVRSPRSHYDVILIVASFATELATPTVTLRTDTLPRLIYRDLSFFQLMFFYNVSKGARPGVRPTDMATVARVACMYIVQPSTAE